MLYRKILRLQGDIAPKATIAILCMGNCVWSVTTLKVDMVGISSGGWSHIQYYILGNGVLQGNQWRRQLDNSTE